MNNIILTLSLLVSLSQIMAAQNLIPNGSFEDVAEDYCGFLPSVKKFKILAKPWITANDTRPELMSRSVTRDCWNYIADSFRPPDGSRAALILLNSKRGMGSYLQVELKEQLKSGCQYAFECYYYSYQGESLSSAFIGVLFSDTLVYKSGFRTLAIEPQLCELLKVERVWKKMTIEFTAMSSDKYLIIGGFAECDDDNLMTEDIFVMVDSLILRRIV